MFSRHKRYWQWMMGPVWSAFLIAVLFAAILLPYWWLAVQWSYHFFIDSGLRFTFITTTFLLVLIIADSIFLVRYFQIIGKNKFEQNVKELRQATDSLRIANKKLNLLSSITRHDIRNQLMALKSYIELSGESMDNSTRLAEFFKKEGMIADNIERQINFTGDYEEMGVNSPAWQNVDAIVNKVASGHHIREIRIETNCPGWEILADPLFEKVFFNLIDNALRYGGQKMTVIQTSLQDYEKGLVISVEDDGDGISDGDKKRLFERGFGKNTGLGLFLSSEILSITGISIRETGEPGKGARFEMTVPKGNYRSVNVKALQER